MATPIRRTGSIFSLPARELGYVVAQGVGFCGVVYIVLALFGLLPASVNAIAPLIEGFSAPEADGAAYELPEAPEEEEPVGATVPERVSIPSIGVDAQIYVPAAIDVSTLDALLARGAVYYPGSGTLERGNIFVFGHSTNWSVVRNQAYKTFNRLDELKPGDTIFVYAGGRELTYTVDTVRIAPDSEVLVSFGGGARRLTLSTCNTFGLKEERVVVEAVAID